MWEKKSRVGTPWNIKSGFFQRECTWSWRGLSKGKVYQWSHLTHHIVTTLFAIYGCLKYICIIIFAFLLTLYFNILLSTKHAILQYCNIILKIKWLNCIIYLIIKSCIWQPLQIPHVMWAKKWYLMRLWLCFNAMSEWSSLLIKNQ